jgi:hypothetical protein
MSIKTKKGRLLRYGLGLFGVFALALLTIYVQRNDVALSLLEQRIEPIEKRLNVELDIGALDLVSLSEVVVEDVRFAHESKARVKVQRVVVELESPSLSLRTPKPMAVKLTNVELFLNSQGGVAGLLSDLQQLTDLRKSATKSKAPKQDTSSRGRITDIEIDQILIHDAAGWGDVSLSDVRLIDGQFQAHLSMTKPVSAQCAISGSLESVELRCSKPIRLGNPRLGYVTISSAVVRRKPIEMLELEGVAVELSERIPSVFRSVFEGLRADLSASRPDPQTGTVPLKLSLVLPGGGRIDGTGKLGPLGGTLQASVDGLQFGDETSRASGKISGEYKLDVSVLQKSVALDGRGRIQSFLLSHDALAEAPIGPFDIGLGGSLSAKKNDEGLEVKLVKGTFELGDLNTAFSADFKREQERWEVGVDAELEPLEFSELLRSIPPKLLPHVEGIKAKGPLSATMHLRIDSAKLDDTELDIDIDTKRFKVERLSAELDFNALRHMFTTRFEMPEDDNGDRVIYQRALGPGAERFVPLSDMSPLLPLAVMAQEDASFRKHKGVSLFHLRGSLVDNLKKGRFVRGGSTVTMQLARNLFLNRRKTLSRKIEEIIVAWLLERRFDKDELMALYLNAVEFGPDIFGVREASQHYFALHPRALSPAQTAWLIKLLPGPRLYYAQFKKKRLNRGFKDNLNWLMRHMIRKGFMEQSQYEPVTETSLFEEPRAIETQEEVSPTPPSTLP